MSRIDRNRARKERRASRSGAMCVCCYWNEHRNALSKTILQGYESFKWCIFTVWGSNNNDVSV